MVFFDDDDADEKLENIKNRAFNIDFIKDKIIRQVVLKKINYLLIDLPNKLPKRLGREAYEFRKGAELRKRVAEYTKYKKQLIYFLKYRKYLPEKMKKKQRELEESGKTTWLCYIDQRNHDIGSFDDLEYFAKMERMHFENTRYSPLNLFRAIMGPLKMSTNIFYFLREAKKRAQLVPSTPEELVHPPCFGKIYKSFYNRMISKMPSACQKARNYSRTWDTLLDFLLDWELSKIDEEEKRE